MVKWMRRCRRKGLIITFAILALLDVNYIQADDNGFEYSGLKNDRESGSYAAKARDNAFFATILSKQEYAPGVYRASFEYQGASPEGACVAVYAYYFPKREKQTAYWQLLTVPPKQNGVWNKAAIILKLDYSSQINFVFNKPKPETLVGDITNFAIKNFRVEPIDVNANLLPNNGFFEEGKDSWPQGWTIYKPNALSDLSFYSTSDISFKNSSSVFVIKDDEKSDVAIQTTPCPFPADGDVEFSIWLRALKEHASVGLLLKGDNYKWIESKRLSVGTEFKKITLRKRAPDKIHQQNYFSCQLTLKAGQGVYIGKAEIKYVKNKKIALSDNHHNHIINPDFNQGDYAYEEWYYQINDRRHKMSADAYINRPEPKVIDVGNGERAMKIAPGTVLNTFSVPAEYGKEYTFSADIKNAVKGKNAECVISLIDNKWNWQSEKVKSSDEWRRVSRVFKIKRKNNRGQAYIRVEPIKNNSILIDKLQFVSGDESLPFQTPPIEATLVACPGKTNFFSDTDRDAVMDLNIKAKNLDIYPAEVVITIRDAWKKTCQTEKIIVSEPGDTTQQIKVNPDGKRGVFEADISVLSKAGKEIFKSQSRYAVLRDLSGEKREFSVSAGHLGASRSVKDHAEINLPLIKKYIPVNTYNRFFVYNPHCSSFAPSEKDINAYKTMFDLFRNSGDNVKNIAVLSLGPYKDKIIKSAIPFSSDLAKEYKDYIQTIVKRYGSSVQGYELVNEPNLSRVNGELALPPEKVAEIYRIGYQAIKNVDPKLIVAGPCATTSSLLKYTDNFLKSGGGENIDVLSFHGYCNNPDSYDTFWLIEKLRNSAAKAGIKEIPLFDSEQYFCHRFPKIRLIEAEYYKGYSYSDELEFVSNSTENMIHHAAAGVPLANFGFPRVFWAGCENNFHIFAQTAASNALIDILGNSKSGRELPYGTAVKAFIFPSTDGSTIVTARTRGKSINGTIELPNEIEAFDVMGNPIKSEKIPLTFVPVYLKFPKGTSDGDVEETLYNAKVLGLGEPFAISLTMRNKDTLDLHVTNRSHINRTVQAAIFEDGHWTQKTEPLTIAPGMTGTSRFKLGQDRPESLKKKYYKFKLYDSDTSIELTASLSLIYSYYNKSMKPSEGPAAWKNFNFTVLGGDNRSKKFHRELDWKGDDDLSCSFASCWNETGLFFAFKVKDDTLSLPDMASRAYAYDSIQLYFDLKRGKESGRDGLTSWQISMKKKDHENIAYLERAQDGRYIGANNKSSGVDPEVKTKIEHDQDGDLFYEVFFPKNVFPTVKFVSGTSMGFSFLVNDNDGTSKEDRKTGLTTAPAGTEPFGCPANYNDLILIDK